MEKLFVIFNVGWILIPYIFDIAKTAKSRYLYFLSKKSFKMISFSTF